jgi:FHA domain
MTPADGGMEASYSPGSWVALAGRSLWLLVDVDPSTPAVQEWWSAIRDGATADDVLGLLAQEGFRVVQSFALVEFDGTAGTLALRGEASIEVSASGDPTSYAADGVATWLHHELDRSVNSFAMVGAGATDSAVRLPMASGVSMAGAIHVSPVGALPVQARPAADPEPPASEVPPEPPPGAPGPSASVFAREDDTPDVADEEEPDAAAPTSFDHLFGATQRPPEVGPVEAQVDVPVTPDPAAPPLPAPDQLPATSQTLAPTNTMYPRPEAGSGKSGLIDALPWDIDAGPTDAASAAVALPPKAPPMVASVAPVLPPASVPPKRPAAPSDLVDATVNRAALLAAAAADEQPPHPGPTVHASRCSSGHLSPAYAGTCRICNEALASQSAFTAPRPLLGALRLSTGDVVTLDRGVMLGRAPDAPEGNDPDRPHVVKLASPENDISRTHLEVRLDGWHVLVVDLDSTNGTVVTLPGQPPMRLRANDPMAIEPGTVVSLADEVTFVFEVPF